VIKSLVIRTFRFIHQYI